MRKPAFILLLLSCSILYAQDISVITDKLDLLKGFHDFGWLEKRDIVVDKLLNDGYVIEQSKDSISFLGEHLGYSCVILFEFLLDNLIKAYAIIDGNENIYRNIVIKVTEQFGAPGNIRDDGRLRTWVIPYGHINGMITALHNENSTVMLYNLHFIPDEEKTEHELES
ncbi:MAG: hypothetical protein FWB95_05700 [Treponema sp.]|nr:hypothetical protein [Treponema sp.]